MDKKQLLGAGVALSIFSGVLYFLLASVAPSARQQIFFQFFIEHETHPGMEKYLELTRTPLSVIRMIGRTYDEVIFDLPFVINEHNMRVPIRQVKDATHHSIFAGCSFTFGIGLEIPDTLPALYQAMKPGHQSYNLGFPGGGAQNTLRYLELFDIADSVKEKKGEFYYLFITEQLDRFFLRYNTLDWMPGISPYYNLDDGKITYQGLVKDQDRAKFFYKMKDLNLAHSLMRNEKKDEYSDEEIEIFALAIKKMKEEYLKKFPQGEFKFATHPLGITDPKITHRVVASVLRQKIQVVNLQNYYIGSEDRPEYVIKYDRHPNALFNREFAKYLAK